MVYSAFPCLRTQIYEIRRKKLHFAPLQSSQTFVEFYFINLLGVKTTDS